MGAITCVNCLIALTSNKMLLSDSACGSIFILWSYTTLLGDNICCLCSMNTVVAHLHCSTNCKGAKNKKIMFSVHQYDTLIFFA